MKKSEIYRGAANFLCSGADYLQYACGACYYIQNDFVAGKALIDLFAPTDNFDRNKNFWPDYSPDSQNERVLMLCLASAIAESEGD